MYKLVIDLEMNGIHTKENPSGEIIEIGAVLLNEDYEIINKYSTYVKPNIVKISKRVKELTNIKTTNLIVAPKLKEVIYKLIEITPDLSKTTLYTWSNSDTITLKQELKAKRITLKEVDKLCKNYIDVQKVFGKRIGVRDSINLTKALNMIGLGFDGKEHSDLADAINTAQILKEVNTNKDIKKTIHNINSYMKSEPLTLTIGNLINDIQIKDLGV